jgi:hypothetical protein
MCISDDKHYDFITRQLEYTNEKIIQAFELFIKLFIVISGGIIWLKTQNFEDNFLKVLITPVRFLLILMGVGSIAVIILNLKSWWGYRKAQARLTTLAPSPRHFLSYLHEIILILIVSIATCLAVFYVGIILKIPVTHN